MKLTRIFALILCLMLGVSGVFGAQLNDKRLTLLDKKERLVGFEDKIVVLFSVFCSHCYAHFKQGSWELIAGIDPRVKVELWQMLQAVEGGDDYAMWAYARKLDEARGIDMFKTNSAQYKLAVAHFGAIFEQGVREPQTFYNIGLKTLQEASRLPFLTIEEVRRSAAEDAKSAEYIARIKKTLSIVEKTGTPAVIVGGKWLVNFEHLKGEADLVEAVMLALKNR